MEENVEGPTTGPGRAGYQKGVQSSAFDRATNQNHLHIQENHSFRNRLPSRPELRLGGHEDAAATTNLSPTRSGVHSSIQMSKYASTNATLRELKDGPTSSTAGTQKDGAPLPINAPSPWTHQDPSNSINAGGQPANQASNMNFSNYSVRVSEFRQQAAVQAHINAQRKSASNTICR